MTIPLMGFIASTIVLVSLSVLFRYETRRGSRYFPRVRVAADSGVIYIEQKARAFSRYVGRAMIRQTMHYLFHKMLTSALRFLEESEQRIKRMLRANKTIARRLDTDERPKNKLDEIAEHKQAVALSDEEKQKHKDRALEG